MVNKGRWDEVLSALASQGTDVRPAFAAALGRCAEHPVPERLLPKLESIAVACGCQSLADEKVVSLTVKQAGEQLRQDLNSVTSKPGDYDNFVSRLQQLKARWIRVFGMQSWTVFVGGIIDLQKHRPAFVRRLQACK